MHSTRGWDYQNIHRLARAGPAGVGPITRLAPEPLVAVHAAFRNEVRIDRSFMRAGWGTERGRSVRRRPRNQWAHLFP